MSEGELAFTNDEPIAGGALTQITLEASPRTRRNMLTAVQAASVDIQGSAGSTAVRDTGAMTATARTPGGLAFADSTLDGRN